MQRFPLSPFLRCASLVLLLAIGSASLATAANPPAELILRGAAANPDQPAAPAAEQILTPSAAFELRCAEPMVTPEHVGSEEPASPIVFTPPLPGTFRWTSQRGGVFTLSASPTLDTVYHAAVRPDLAKADGQPLNAADVRATYRTPAMEAWFGKFFDGKDLPSTPKTQLLFNAAVDPDKLAPFLKFQNAAGLTVAAIVRTPDNSEKLAPYMQFQDVGGHAASTGTSHRAASHQLLSDRTWTELFFAAHASSDDKIKTAPALNRVIVTPAEPLPVGEGWTLLVAPGLPSTEPGVKIPGAARFAVGNVLPFEVRAAKAENGGEDARQITLRFSKAMAREVTAENIGKWVHVTPRPENLAFKVHEPEHERMNMPVEITGDFQIDQKYAVTVDAGLPAWKAYTLADTFRQDVVFAEETPLLALPEYTTHQLSSGRREFALLARNAPEFRLRAKLIPAEAAGMALVAYEAEYVNHESDPGGQKRMDFDQAPGKIIYEKVLPGAAGTDKPQTITLKWDDILGERRNGIVLLEVEQPTPSVGQTKRAGAQALVQVTDLGAIWKTSRGGEMLAYAFSLTDTHPAASARVQLLDEKGLPLGEAKADADGLAHLPGKLLDKAAWLSVSTGEDCHVVSFERGERTTIGTYGFHLPATAYPSYEDDESDDPDKPTPTKTRQTVLFFSDRGVYKPGETAQIKATVREWHDGGLTTPAPKTAATLRAYDARGRKFWEKEAALSATGSLTESVVLPKTTLGRYRVVASFHAAGEAAAKEDADNSEDMDDEDDEDDDSGGSAGSSVCRFQVQEFQPNPFEVMLKKPDFPVGAGETPVGLAAHYYMGKTLSRAKAVWSLKADDTPFAPAGFDEYHFCTGVLDYRLRKEPGELSLNGQAALADDGTLTISPNIVLNAAQPAPRKVNLQASVTDLDQQTVAAHARYTVHSSDFYLGLREMPDVVRAGEPLPVEIVAVNARDEQPLDAAAVKVTAKLFRVEWHTNRVANDSGDSDYDNKPHLLPIGNVEVENTAVRKLGKEWEPASLVTEPGAVPTAPAVSKLVPTEPGEYLLELTAHDTHGRRVLTNTSFSVLGDKEAEWSYRNAWQAPLVPDRAEYTPGQTATILIKTPISGRALVTVEREGVSRAFVTEIAKQRPAVQVPILPGDAPNVFVSVVLVRGSGQSTRRVKQPEYRAGYCQLLVPKPDARMAVEVKPAKPEYQPGDGVDVQVDVTDPVAHGPVAGAEVTLYAVDKGVLSLTGYKTPEPLRTFYRPRPLDVRTGLTIPNLLSEDPDDLNFSSDKGFAANKGYLIGGGGGEGQRDRLRQNFVACAYWNAALVTDAEGRVHAYFQAPDGLTEYQVMAVVSQGAGRFGSGEGAFRINKPVMLEPAMPRFGNVGDHLTLRAVVHNQSGAAGEAEVTVELDDKATVLAADGQPSDTARVRRVPLAAGESKAVEFPIEFRKTGPAVWTWRARLTGGEQSWRDSVRTTLNVDHPTPRRSEVAYAHIEADRTDDLLGKINPELMEGEDGTIQVSLSTSRLSELRESVDELLHYPYGCVEQTTSSLLPWLALQDFSGVLPDLRHTPEEAQEAVSRGINKLLSMQTDSGGLAYWPGDSARQAHPWGSAYGALGMALTKRAGFFVPESNLNKLCEYLSNRLRSNDKDAHDTYHEHNTTDRCLALYALALAGKGEPAYDEQFYNRRDKLNAEDRALVALAIIENKGPAEMVKALLQSAPQDKPADDDWDEFTSPATVDGMRLLAWCRFQPRDPGIDEKLTRLLDEREGRGGWQTTQGNAWALLAMSAYARDVEKSGGPAAGTVSLAGQSRDFQLSGKTQTFACEFPLSAATSGGGNKLAVLKTTGRKLYAQAKVESRPRGGIEINKRATVGSEDYSIVRHYQKILGDGNLADAESLKVGDRVLVSLDIHAPRLASYVAVNDPLPAVLEAINPEFKTADAGNVKGSGYGWWFSDYKELRDDRAVFFCDHLYSGHFRLQYLARVRAAGTATAPAAKIEEMYHPDHFAETAAGKVSSSPLE